MTSDKTPSDRISPKNAAAASPAPSIDALKQQARRLRDSLNQAGRDVTHSESLELVAAQHGFRDWNTAYAAAGNRPAVKPLQLGARVAGRYLGQIFAGEIVGVSALGPDRFRLTLQFDAPVDVVTFESFSAYRSRVTAIVDAQGTTAEKTSNGAPQLTLEVL